MASNTVCPLSSSSDPNMASKLASLFLVLATLFVTTQAFQPHEQTNQPKPSRIDVDSVSAVLSDKGYHAMSLTLDTILEAVMIPIQLLAHNNDTLTIFCPKDQAFFTSKYPQPPLTLLKYHIVPFKIEKDTFNKPDFGHGSKVDTLLSGHPLVVTSLPAGTGSSLASLNQVKVTEWDVYNDGRLIVHGVEDFFDPAFQTLRYPQHDVVVGIEDRPCLLKEYAPDLEIITWLLWPLAVAFFFYVVLRLVLLSNKPCPEGEYAPLN